MVKITKIWCWNGSSISHEHTKCGVLYELGNVDYHNNDGNLQPSCWNIPIDALEWAISLCHHQYAFQLMVHVLFYDVPCIFEGDQGNVCISDSNATGYRDISPIISIDLKSSQPCIGNKLAVTIGSLNHPSTETMRPNWRYEIVTTRNSNDVTNKCTISCK